MSEISTRLDPDDRGELEREPRLPAQVARRPRDRTRRRQHRRRLVHRVARRLHGPRRRHASAPSVMASTPGPPRRQCRGGAAVWWSPGSSRSPCWRPCPWLPPSAPASPGRRRRGRANRPRRAAGNGRPGCKRRRTRPPTTRSRASRSPGSSKRRATRWGRSSSTTRQSRSRPRTPMRSRMRAGCASSSPVRFRARTREKQLVTSARSLLDRAVQADPNLADAHYYRGVLLLDGFNEADGAISEFQRYLVLAPDGQFRHRLATRSPWRSRSPRARVAFLRRLHPEKPDEELRWPNPPRTRSTRA